MVESDIERDGKGRSHFRTIRAIALWDSTRERRSPFWLFGGKGRSGDRHK
ncbi:hypothetical protein [Microcoleus sp. CAWBG58]|nr:hypothetical protein [Microcoleus sp. CAWBG58]